MVDITPSSPTFGVEPTVGKISVGRVFAQSFGVLGRAWAQYYLVSLVIALFGLPAIGNLLVKGNGALHLAAAVCAVVKPIFALVAQAALIDGTMRLLAGPSMDLRAAFGVGLRRVLPYLAATLILVLGIMLGAILLIVPGIILACMYGLSPVVAVVERLGPIASQTRSRELTRNNRWRILGASMLFYLIPTLLVAGAAFAAGVTHASSLPISVSLQVVSLVFGLVATPLYVTFPVILYDHLRQATASFGPRGISGVFD